MSDVATLCDICSMPADHRCKLCGRRVCDMHFDAERGICTSCKFGRQAKEKNEEKR